MKKVFFVVFCCLLFVFTFACQEDLSKDANNKADTYGNAIFGKSEYGESE